MEQIELNRKNTIKTILENLSIQRQKLIKDMVEDLNDLINITYEKELSPGLNKFLYYFLVNDDNGYKDHIVDQFFSSIFLEYKGISLFREYYLYHFIKNVLQGKKYVIGYTISLDKRWEPAFPQGIYIPYIKWDMEDSYLPGYTNFEPLASLLEELWLKLEKRNLE